MKKYICKNQYLTDKEKEIEELFNEMSEMGYEYVNSFPAECGGSGKIYSMNHIFVKRDDLLV